MSTTTDSRSSSLRSSASAKASTLDRLPASSSDLDVPEPSRALDPAPSATAPSPRPPPFSSLYPPTTPPPPLDAASDAPPVLAPRVTEPAPPLTLTALAPLAAAPDATDALAPHAPSRAEAEVKAALPQDTKAESGSRRAAAHEDAEPPPPYTEGDSPLEGFGYVMAAAGGAASIITQVQQGAPAPVNALGGMFFFSFGGAKEMEADGLV